MLPNLNPFKIDTPNLLSIDKACKEAPIQHHDNRFNPYQDNGGNVVGI